MSSEPAPMIDEDGVWFLFISHCSLKTQKSESEDILFSHKGRIKEKPQNAAFW
jgi:hypothetical protein